MACHEKKIKKNEKKYFSSASTFLTDCSRCRHRKHQIFFGLSSGLYWAPKVVTKLIPLFGHIFLQWFAMLRCV